ncbi:unnamed protein product, partial [Closterium sp. Naga37s-1]
MERERAERFKGKWTDGEAVESGGEELGGIGGSEVRDWEDGRGRGEAGFGVYEGEGREVRGINGKVNGVAGGERGGKVDVLVGGDWEGVGSMGRGEGAWGDERGGAVVDISAEVRERREERGEEEREKGEESEKGGKGEEGGQGEKGEEQQEQQEQQEQEEGETEEQRRQAAMAEIRRSADLVRRQEREEREEKERARKVSAEMQRLLVERRRRGEVVTQQVLDAVWEEACAVVLGGKVGGGGAAGTAVAGSASAGKNYDGVMGEEAGRGGAAAADGAKNGGEEGRGQREVGKQEWEVKGQRERNVQMGVGRQQWELEDAKRREEQETFFDALNKLYEEDTNGGKGDGYKEDGVSELVENLQYGRGEWPPVEGWLTQEEQEAFFDALNRLYGEGDGGSKGDSKQDKGDGLTQEEQEQEAFFDALNRLWHFGERPHGYGGATDERTEGVGKRDGISVSDPMDMVVPRMREAGGGERKRGGWCVACSPTSPLPFPRSPLNCRWHFDELLVQAVSQYVNASDAITLIDDGGAEESESTAVVGGSGGGERGESVVVSSGSGGGEGGESVVVSSGSGRADGGESVVVSSGSGGWEGGESVVVSSSKGMNGRQSWSLEETQAGRAGRAVGSGEEGWSNTKQWAEDIRARYEEERDPDAKDVIQQLGKDLPRWLSEEEITSAPTLSQVVEAGREGGDPKQRAAVKSFLEKVREEKERFGAEAVAEKYLEQARDAEEEEARRRGVVRPDLDRLWWLDLQAVWVVMIMRWSSSSNGTSSEGQRVQRVPYSFQLPPDWGSSTAYSTEGVYNGDTAAGAAGAAAAEDAWIVVGFEDVVDAARFSEVLRVWLLAHPEELEGEEEGGEDEGEEAATGVAVEGAAKGASKGASKELYSSAKEAGHRILVELYSSAKEAGHRILVVQRQQLQLTAIDEPFPDVLARLCDAAAAGEDKRRGTRGPATVDLGPLIARAGKRGGEWRRGSFDDVRLLRGSSSRGSSNAGGEGARETRGGGEGGSGGGTKGGRENVIHVMLTSNGSPYMNWQSRIMYYTYLQVAGQPGSEMKHFTRVLHRSTDDALMDVMPTVRVKPLDPTCDTWCEYPVASRPYAIQQWLESGDVKGEWIFMIETDYIFVKPVSIPPAGRALGFPFDYIAPQDPNLLPFMRRYYPEPYRIEDVPRTGNAPTIMRYDDMMRVVPIWVNVTAGIEGNAESKERFGWVREMYAFSISVALAGVKIDLPPMPHAIMSQPPADKVVGDAALLHYTWGSQIKDWSGNVVWEFDKRKFTDRGLPDPVPEPPEGKASESQKVLVSKVNEAINHLPKYTLRELREMGRSEAEIGAYEKEWRAKGYVEGTKGGGEGGGGGGVKQEQQGGVGQAGGAGQVIGVVQASGVVQGGGGVAKGGAAAQQEVAKAVVVPGEMEKGSIHAMVTSNGNAYMNWQTLLMFHTYKKVASEPGSNLRFFTRVLHRTKDDELMHLVPTVRVRPLEPKCDDWCEYPVADRPFAIQQWLESGDVKGDWIFMIETDYLFVKPVAIPPMGRAVGFPFGYIIPTYPSIHHIMIRYYPGDLKDIPQTGNAPVLAPTAALARVVPIWVDITARFEKDEEAKKDLGWVREMYAFSIAAALGNMPIDLPLVPHAIMVQPPADSVLGDAAIIHYTWGYEFKDEADKVVWRFDKRDYTQPGQVPPILADPPQG